MSSAKRQKSRRIRKWADCSGVRRNVARRLPLAQGVGDGDEFPGRRLGHLLLRLRLARSFSGLKKTACSRLKAASPVIWSSLIW